MVVVEYDSDIKICPQKKTGKKGQSVRDRNLARSTKHRMHKNPATYTITAKSTGPKYSFGIKRPSGTEKAADFPAPNFYTIKSTIGSGPKVVMKKRPFRNPALTVGPGPLDYNPVLGPGGPAWSMRFQPLGTGAEIIHPAPNAYTLRDSLCGRKGPLFGKRVAATTTSSMEFSYSQDYESKNNIPVSYLKTTPFTKNDGPFFALKSRPRDSISTVNQPAPNTYFPSCDAVKPSTPKFSLGGRIITKPKKAIEDYKYYEPYNPPTGPAFSFCAPVETYEFEEDEKPAPNIYYPKISRWGPNKQLSTTFKGRHSPYVYSGFKRVPTMKQVDGKAG